MSEINVTPFVDVLLILFVAFLISAPLLTHSLPVKLPQGKLDRKSQKFEDSLVVTIDENHNIILGDEVFRMNTLQKQFPHLPEGQHRERPVYIQMDERVPYGFLVQLMIFFKNSGFPRVGLVFRNQ